MFGVPRLRGPGPPSGGKDQSDPRKRGTPNGSTRMPPNWLCLAGLACSTPVPQIPQFAHVWLCLAHFVLDSPCRLAELALFRRIGLRTPPGLAQIGFVCTTDPGAASQIGFVSHTCPSQGPSPPAGRAELGLFGAIAPTRRVELAPPIPLPGCKLGLFPEAGHRGDVARWLSGGPPAPAARAHFGVPGRNWLCLYNWSRGQPEAVNRTPGGPAMTLAYSIRNPQFIRPRVLTSLPSAFKS